jgi:serine protease AprX
LGEQQLGEAFVRRYAILVMTTMLVTSLVISVQPAAGASAARPVDKNANKIFDTLEKSLRGMTSEAKFDVIAVFSSGTSTGQATASRSVIGSFHTTYEYKTLSAFAARLTVGQIVALSKRPALAQIQPDARLTFEMETARAQFGVDKAIADFGHDGNNELGSCPGARDYCPDDTVVAVLDTGMDKEHLDLDGGKIIGSAMCADPPCIDNWNYYGTSTHGTHVGSIIAGEGDGNNAHRGVAPGAALVSVTVGADPGATVSAVDAGLEWILAHQNQYGVDALNMSIGSEGPSDGTDSTSRLVNRAVAAGITTLVSAGNNGPNASTAGAPGTAKFATTVGAMNDTIGGDQLNPVGLNLAYFSSRGPTADGRIKPEIAAPGVDITAAAPGTFQNNYARNTYASHSGTSMSSPFTAGVAALMLDADPSLVSSGTACPLDDITTECLDGVIDSTMSAPVKDKLLETAVDWGPAGPDNEYGFGRLDAYAAVDSASLLVGTGGPPIPTHAFTSGSLSGTGAIVDQAIPVTGTQYPVSVTFISPTTVRSVSGSGTVTTTPNFDVTLLDPAGIAVASSVLKDRRQETVGYQPLITGTYTLRITSVAGSGPYFMDVSLSGSSNLPPVAPGNLVAVGSPTAVDLTWTDVSGETGYRIQRSSDGKSGWSDIGLNPAGVTTYRDSALVSGTDFYYRVMATSAPGDSSPSNTASARAPGDNTAPATPSNLKATSGKAKVTLTWGSSTDAGGSGLAGYKVYRSTTGSTGTYSQIAAPTTTSFIDTAVSKGKTYWYYVKSYDNAGNHSAASSKVSGKPT